MTPQIPAMMFKTPPPMPAPTRLRPTRIRKIENRTYFNLSVPIHIRPFTNELDSDPAVFNQIGIRVLRLLFGGISTNDLLRQLLQSPCLIWIGSPRQPVLPQQLQG